MKRMGPSVVIEFGDGDVRVCRSEVRRGERRVTNCRVLPFKTDEPLIWPRWMRPFGVRKRTCRVILSLPRQEASVRVYRLPSADEQETASMIAWKVRREPALSDKDVLVAHRIVGRDKEGWTRVLVYGVSRSKVLKRLRFLDRAGISVQVVTLETQGIVDWTRGGAALEALIHAEGDVFEWSVAREGVPIFSRSFRASCAGPDAGEALLRELSVSHGIFRQWYPDLATGALPLNALGVLSEQHLTALRPRLNGRGDRDLLIFDGERGHGPRSLIPVIGLALKGSKDPIDVTPSEWRQELKKRSGQSMIRRCCLGLLAGLVLFCAHGLFAARQDASRWEDARDKARALTLWSQRMDKRVAWERSVPAEPLSGLWDRLSERMPAEVYLTELALDKTGVRISGWTNRPSLVLDLWERVKEEVPGLQLESVSAARNADGERSVFCMVQRARSS